MRAMGVALAAALLLVSPPVVAHETKVTGAQRVTLGWRNEPALTGVPNSVDIALADASGAPVAAAGASLRVEVAFGEEVMVLALLPGATPGVFSAPLVPTRAGTYTFHVTGSAGGQSLDISSTCSERTFDCVTDAAEAQFPAKDPSTGQLAARVEQGSRRLARAESAADAAEARANVALGAAAVAILLAAGSVLRSRRRPRP
jgi:hypothetical protein